MADSSSEHHASRISSADWDALARYFSGESDGAERTRMQRELAEHPERGVFLATLDDALVAPPPSPLTPAEVDAALASVMARRGATVTALRPGARWARPGMRAAAAFLMVVGSALVARAIARRSAGTDVSVPRLATGVGALDSLRLDDGTRVVLGPNSSLVVLPGYGDESRTLTLRGQAKFDVAHDAGRPFTVHAGAATLRDVGTIFTVQTEAGGGVLVGVAEGAVAVTKRDAAGSPHDTLRAGDRATISSAGVLAVARGAMVPDDTAWLDQRLVLRDATLAEVAADLRRWYGLDLRVADSALAARHVTATFDHDSRRDVGHLLGAALGASVRQSGDTIWLQPAPGSAGR